MSAIPVEILPCKNLKFSLEENAQKYLSFLKERKRNARFFVHYFCNQCDCWHIGSPPKPIIKEV